MSRHICPDIYVWYQGINVPRYQGTKVPRYLGTWVPGYRTTLRTAPVNINWNRLRSATPAVCA